MGIRGRPAQLPAASGPPAAQIFGRCSSFFSLRTTGRPRRNYKSQHAPRYRAYRPFPAADAREQVVVFMRRHWRLEPGRRHGDNRCGRAEEALPSGRYPGLRSGECGGPRMQLMPSGIAPGGCLLAVSSVLTLSGDLGWKARPGGRGLAGCIPRELRAGRPGIRVRLHPYAEMPRASPCGRSEIPGVRNEKVPACSPETHF